MICRIELHPAAQRELTKSFLGMKNVHRAWGAASLKQSMKEYLNYQIILRCMQNEKPGFVKRQ
jgi:hypothetical protein